MPPGSRLRCTKGSVRVSAHYSRNDDIAIFRLGGAQLAMQYNVDIGNGIHSGDTG